MAADNTKHPNELFVLSELKGRIPLIGLTGGIGSGKTAVSKLLEELGVGIIDTDQIAHQITSAQGSAIPLIQERFGSEYISSDGSLDRNKMRALVFSDSSARKLLESVTHPLIRQATALQALQLAKRGSQYLVFVVPLLLESGNWQALIDHLVVVDCPKETQIQRVMQRSNLSRDEIERVLTSQVSREDRLKHADTVITNLGSFGDLKVEVLNLHQKILQIRKDQLSSS